MSKITVAVTGQYPLWDDEQKTYLTHEPRSVDHTEWIKCQVEAGYLRVVEVELAEAKVEDKKADKAPKDTKAPEGN